MFIYRYATHGYRHHNVTIGINRMHSLSVVETILKVW